jgi:hypothetical protein
MQAGFIISVFTQLKKYFELKKNLATRLKNNQEPSAQIEKVVNKSCKTLKKTIYRDTVPITLY